MLTFSAGHQIHNIVSLAVVLPIQLFTNIVQDLPGMKENFTFIFLYLYLQNEDKIQNNLTKSYCYLFLTDFMNLANL